MAPARQMLARINHCATSRPETDTLDQSPTEVCTAEVKMTSQCLDARETGRWVAKVGLHDNQYYTKTEKENENIQELD
jgi:hypothetical protein